MRHRLQYLDSARGLAAMAVLIFHAVLAFGEQHDDLKGLAFIFKKYLDLGKIAVIVFFVISGFVIPYSIKGNDLKSSVKSFIISRFFRLYPVYWLSVILGYIIIGGVNKVEFAMNFTMLQQFLGFKNIIGLYWTLQIELIFYFLVVIVFVLDILKNSCKMFIASLLFLISAVIMGYFRYYYEIKLPIAIPLSLSLMFFGSYYRSSVLSEDTSSKKFVKLYAIIYFLVIPVVSILAYNKDMGFNESWYKYTITYYLGMIIFLILGKYQISSRFTEYLGKISYSVYLFHPIVIAILELVDFRTPHQGIIKVVIAIFITTIFSHYAFQLIEAPSIRMGRKIKEKYMHQNIK